MALALGFMTSPLAAFHGGWDAEPRNRGGSAIPK